MTILVYLHNHLAQGEGINLEFKESRHSLSRSIDETICVFLNRKDGHILLGIKDDSTILGIAETSIPIQLNTLANDLNTPELISPTLFLSTGVITINQK